MYMIRFKIFTILFTKVVPIVSFKNQQSVNEFLIL